jgi:hypothetical protein
VILLLLLVLLLMLAVRTPLFVVIGTAAMLAFGFFVEGYQTLEAHRTTTAVQLAELTSKSVLLAIPFFVISGAIMTAGGIAQRLVRVADVLVGHLRGGLAIASVLSCMVFAAISGSSVVTLIAVGELTNVAALLDSEPGIAKKIRAISLMGGAVYRGYAPGSKPEPEWNIKSNAAAARTVFTSGVPLLVAPLDSTADLKLTPDMRVRIFMRGTPLNDALGALDQIWRHTNHWKGDLPTLFDVLAVELVVRPERYELRPLRIEVTSEGVTRPVAGDANSKVAVSVDIAEFMEEFVRRLAGR